MQLATDLTVLVVDDDEEFVSALRVALNSSGYQVLQALSGMQGLAFIHEAQPVHLIVIDIVLPDKSGLELIHAAARSLRPPKVLAISAFQSPLHLEIAKYMGADLAISKFPQESDEPFPAKQWTDTVRQVLDSGPKTTSARI
jgi:CheY-like chemotaxis protein